MNDNVQNGEVIIDINDLSKAFGDLKVLTNISTQIRKGDVVCVIGPSGSGKSTTGRALIRLYDPTDGKIIFDGHDISGKLSKEDESYLRTNMQMIFQDPMACLNPRKKVKEIIAQGLEIHHVCKTQAELDEKVNAILDKVGLSREHATRYPQQFSGGQRQRIGIARALVMNPKLVIADEAISALDVSIQAQVVNLMKDLQDELGTTYLFIAHDLSMVKYISDRIGVMHLGHIVETGTTEEIFANPIHPYTRSLLSAIPHPNPIVEKNRVSLEYNKEKEGVDYTKGVIHQLTKTHSVLATEEEFAKWSKIAEESDNVF